MDPSDLSDVRILAVVTACGVLVPLLLLVLRDQLDTRWRAGFAAAAAVLLAVQSASVVRSMTGTWEVLVRVVGVDGSDESNVPLDMVLLLAGLLGGLVAAGLLLRTLSAAEPAYAHEPVLPVPEPEPAPWGQPEFLGDLEHVDAGEPLPPAPPGMPAPAELLLFAGLVAGLAFVSLSPTIARIPQFLGLFGLSSELGPWSLLGAAGGGLLLGLVALTPLLGHQDDPRAPALAGAGLGFLAAANALPAFATALQTNEYWSVFANGLGVGLLLPVAVLAVVRALRASSPTAVWVAATTAVVALMAVATATGLGRVNIFEEF